MRRARNKICLDPNKGWGEKKVSFYLDFAAWVLLARWSVASGRLLASASGALVRLPGLACFVDRAGSGLSAAARLPGAGGDRGSAAALLAPTSVAIIFPCHAGFVCSSIVIADLFKWAVWQFLTCDLAVVVACALGAFIRLEDLPDRVSVSIVIAVARVVSTRNLAIALTSASVAFFGNGLPNGQSHSAVLAVAWHRVV